MLYWIQLGLYTILIVLNGRKVIEEGVKSRSGLMLGSWIICFIITSLELGGVRW
jgi:hypothetical protein